MVANFHSTDLDSNGEGFRLLMEQTSVIGVQTVKSKKTLTTILH